MTVVFAPCLETLLPGPPGGSFFSREKGTEKELFHAAASGGRKNLTSYPKFKRYFCIFCRFLPGAKFFCNKIKPMSPIPILTYGSCPYASARKNLEASASAQRRCFLGVQHGGIFVFLFPGNFYNLPADSIPARQKRFFASGQSGVLHLRPMARSALSFGLRCFELGGGSAFASCNGKKISFDAVSRTSSFDVGFI
ncbi:MAG: hypothetical protein HFF85_10860 [Oscillibacter sp.]|nr:hypothetical protein [Oscillibacter sp.]